MLRLYWVGRLIRDVILAGIVNRSIIASLCVLGLLALGLVIAAAQVSAPFIYTLF